MVISWHAATLTTSKSLNATEKSREHPLTCELQRAAQRALSWSQQRQAGVFGVRVLQALHQRDGCVLHKLHQQLRGEKKKRSPSMKTSTVRIWFKSQPSPLPKQWRWGFEMTRLPLVWSRAHQKAWVTLCGACGITQRHWSIKRTHICYEWLKSSQKEIYLKSDLQNVGFSVGHKHRVQVIFESNPSHNLWSYSRTKPTSRLTVAFINGLGLGFVLKGESYAFTYKFNKLKKRIYQTAIAATCSLSDVLIRRLSVGWNRWQVALLT